METITITEKQVTYLVRSSGTALYMGVGKLEDLVTLRDFKRSRLYKPTESYQVDIIGDYSSEGFELSALQYLPLETVKPQSTQVQCVETGEVYRSAYECARALGLNQSALCNHLNGKVGFKTVRGLTFHRVG